MRRIVLALTMALATPAAAETVAISAAGMVDVVSGKRVERPLVIVTDGRISAVGTQGSLTVPAGAKRIDLGSKTLLPGLIDMHVHLDGLAEVGGYNGLQYTDSFWSMVAVKNARDMLNAGFTTVRNVGSADRNDIGLKEAINEGYAVGPRIVPAGYAIGATGDGKQHIIFVK